MSKVSHDSETPAHGQQVVTACAFIHKKENGVHKVFLAKRAATKKFLPNVWELPGGHIDFREDIVAGLKREVREEFGVAITVGDPFYVFDYLNELKGSQSVEVDYFAVLCDEEPKRNPEDHSECMWLAEAEVREVFGKTGRLDDLELRAIEKGFALLRGGPHHFG